jgi:molybdenum cofactor cytidylyltransferase
LFAQGRVVEVAVDDAGVLWDVDVPAALVFS